MGNFNTIRDAIKTKLEGLSSIDEVNMYERTGFEGYPAVNVTIQGNDSTAESTASNLRQYIATVRVFIDLEGNPLVETFNNSKEQTETIMSDCVDDILDAFDTDTTLGGIVEMTAAAPSKWGYVEVEEGWARTADITLRIAKIINTN